MLGEDARSCAGLVASLLPLAQSHKQHRVAMQAARERHAASVALEKSRHQERFASRQRSFLLRIFHNLEEHFQQLNADMVSSTKESERDMFEQRNQDLQTVILAASVLFAGVATVIFDGSIPYSSETWFLMVYAGLSALSFLFLLLSVVICVELVIRSSNFMYRRAKTQARLIRTGVGQTRQMIGQMRRDVDPEAADHVGEGDEGGGDRSLASCPSAALHERWTRHETHMSNLLAVREDINSRSAITQTTEAGIGAGTGTAGLTFEQFWRRSCRFWAALGLLCFYLGAYAMVATVAMYMWAHFSSGRYHSVLAGAVSAGLLGCALALGGGLVLVIMRHLRAAQSSSGEGLGGGGGSGRVAPALCRNATAV